jgi:hypothetical protein
MEIHMSDQTFKFAGYSVMSNGTTKARFGNDMGSRVKKLSDNSGHFFVELPTLMTRTEAAKYILGGSDVKTTEVINALQKVVGRNVPKAAVVVNTTAARKGTTI